jgi:hypothetical protein
MAGYWVNFTFTLPKRMVENQWKPKKQMKRGTAGSKEKRQVCKAQL